MNFIKKNVLKLCKIIIDKVMGNGLMQEENTASGQKYITEGMPGLIRKSGAEGIVLLKNNGVLPLKKDMTVSVFGRCQYDSFYVGYGSGGDVHPPYKINLAEGLQANPNIKLNKELMDLYKNWCENPDNQADHGWWGHWPFCFEEMQLSKETVDNAAKNSDTALIVIGRAAGEDRENTLTKGSYYLTDKEISMLDLVTEAFKKIVVILNCGNVIDMAWTEKFGDKIGAVVCAWQLGQEYGNAVADVLTGVVNPCGKLSDTIAKHYEDYPSSANFGNEDFNNYAEDIFVGYRYFETFAKDKVLYPFGFGLSYTQFKIEPVSFEKTGSAVKVKAKVTNTGSAEGKEVIQLYCCPPQGKLSKASKNLITFAKTKSLKAGESEVIELTFDTYYCSSYDDKGVTGHKSAYVLEKGEYEFVIGNSVKADLKAGSFTEKETEIIDQLQEVCGVKKESALKIMNVSEKDGKIIQNFEDAPTEIIDLKQRILSGLPKEIAFSGDKNIKLKDVKDGKATLDQFIAQLNDKELEALTRGEGAMNSKLGVPGNAGAFGGIIQSLRDKGVPPIICTDGPAGIRIKKYTSLMPCGMALACTWNTSLVRQLFE